MSPHISSSVTPSGNTAVGESSGMSTVPFGPKGPMSSEGGTKGGNNACDCIRRNSEFSGMRYTGGPHKGRAVFYPLAQMAMDEP
eukprot:5729834-Alexandrium_andersonii.AAC.1